jgi:hypothetical protein
MVEEDYEEAEKSLKQQLKEINAKIDLAKKQPKGKKFKLPWGKKVSNSQLKKGYATIEVVGENKEIDFVKEPIVDGTIKVGENYYAVDELDIFTYKGKPFVHLPKTKVNPWNPLSFYVDTERTYDGKTMDKNEIYGQKYIMARMKSDFISAKAKIGWGMTIIGLLILGVIAYAFISGK